MPDRGEVGGSEVRCPPGGSRGLEGSLQQAESMPGWGRRSAQDAIAETGADMTKFRAAAHLADKTQTREGARYRRIARRRGKAKAGVALGNTQLKVYHKLLSAPACAMKTSARTTTTTAPAPAASCLRNV